MPSTLSPLICENNHLQIVYDQILQETFTILGEEQVDGNTIAEKSRKLTSPIYFENLNRPPHITLFWIQNLNGHLISNQEIPCIQNLTEQLQKVHEASLIPEFNREQVQNCNLLLKDNSHIISDKTSTNYQLTGDVKQNLAEVLVKLAKKNKIKSLLVDIKDLSTIRDSFLELRAVDKVVFVIAPGFSSSQTSIVPFQIVNLHYEMLGEYIVATGDPRFPL
jgi:hypothetical protein